MRDLTKGSPVRALLLFAIPIIIGNILQLTYSLIDTRIVGQLLGDNALAAVGAVSSMNTLIVGLCGGIGNGFAVIVARYFGAGENRGIQRSVAGAFSLGIFLTFILTLFSLLLLKPFLHLLHTPESIFNLSYQYIFIIIAGMIVTVLYNISSAILRAIGDTVTPLIFLGCSTLLNIGGDLLFIGVFHQGVKGAALATILSQALSAAACVIYMFKKYPNLRFHSHDVLFRLRPLPKNLQSGNIKYLKRANFNLRLFLDLLTCGLSMGLMSCLVNIGSVALQMGINNLGNELITAQMAARKISEFYMILFSVFGTTMATYSGQNFGAGEYGRIRQGMWKALEITWVWCGLVILLSYSPAGPFLIRLVTASNNPVIIDNAVLYLKINTLLYFIPAVICIVRNVMQGIGDHVTPIFSSFIECIGKVLITMLLVPHMKYMGIIIAEPVVWIFMVIPLLVKLVKNPIMKKQKN